MRTQSNQSIVIGCNKILRLPEVMSITGLSRSTIYQRISEEAFPKNINLGGRAVGWLQEDVSNWIDEKIQNQNSEV